MSQARTSKYWLFFWHVEFPLSKKKSHVKYWKSICFLCLHTYIHKWPTPPHKSSSFKSDLSNKHQRNTSEWNRFKFTIYKSMIILHERLFRLGLKSPWRRSNPPRGTHRRQQIVEAKVGCSMGTWWMWIGKSCNHYPTLRSCWGSACESK